MKLSTRSRYGMRALIDLAQNGPDAPVTLREISERQQVSVKYMEHVITRLVKHDIVVSRRGARGGYLLSRPPGSITAKEVVHALEGVPLLIRCVDEPSVCDRSDTCHTRCLWAEMEAAIDETLERVTIADLMDDDYCLHPDLARKKRKK